MQDEGGYDHQHDTQPQGYPRGLREARDHITHEAADHDRGGIGDLGSHVTQMIALRTRRGQDGGV